MTVDRIAAALAVGLTELGENRVQEAEAKIGALGARARPTWHFIGHLQTNKARRAAELFDWVESIDSMRVAEALDRHATALGKHLEVLLEVNTSGEPTKHGVGPEGALELVAGVSGLGRLRLQGFMTVGPLGDRPDDARPAFRALREIRERARALHPELELAELSMGMSGDYEVAVEEGATIVRLGTALFGARI